jgi:hypothetical protein
VSLKYHRVLIYLAMSCGLFAQTPAPPSVALLEGSVVNKVTGAPVKHAHVIYIKMAAPTSDPPSPISTDTDTDGHFAIQLEPGSYRLWVERSGFARQMYGSRTSDGPGTVLTLASGQHLRDLAIRIVPLGAIAGRVFDEEGEPLQGVGIQVLRFSYATGKRQLIPVGGVSSNDRGEYRVYSLPAGRYFLLATPRGTPLTHPPDGGLVAELQEPFAALYYPGVPDPASASQISLPEGGELADINFPLPRVRAVTLRGRILSPVEDFAGSQLQVVLAHNDNNAASYINRVSAAVDKSTGRFEFRGVAPGSYLLVASQLYGKHALGGRVPVEVSGTAPQENLAIALTPGLEITGSVELEGAARNLPNLTVRLTPSEGLALGPQPTSPVGTNGSIGLSGVTPGIWGLTLDPLPQGVWIKAATFGDADVLRGELNVPAGPPGLLHIVLAANGAQISGAVTEDDHPRHATVVLVPAAPELRQSMQMYRATSTQDQGTFSFKGVRPGSYKLFAFEEIEVFAWLDPDFLKLVESLGESISVAEGDKVTRQLAPISPEMLLPGH